MARPRLADKQKDLPTSRRLYTKTEIAKSLGISRGTLLNYEMTAIFNIPDYRDINFKNMRLERRKPLTHYQVWCLGKIARMYAAFPVGTAATIEIARFLKENQLLTSFDSYCEELSKATLQSSA